MFTLYRFGMRAAKNPKLLIPVGGFIVIAFFLESYVLTPRPHPLPGMSNVCDVRITPDPQSNSRSKSISMNSYRRLSMCLIDSEIVPGQPQAATRAILEIDTPEGIVKEVVFYQDGLLTSDGKTFEAPNKDRLFKTLAEISGSPGLSQSPW